LESELRSENTKLTTSYNTVENKLYGEITALTTVDSALRGEVNTLTASLTLAEATLKATTPKEQLKVRHTQTRE
jgi:hypothetical protein